MPIDLLICGGKIVDGSGNPWIYGDLAISGDRGLLRSSAFTDIVTFEDSHRLSTGVRDVWVNGTCVVSAGLHTGATPGQIVDGPGGWLDRAQCARPGRDVPLARLSIDRDWFQGSDLVSFPRRASSTSLLGANISLPPT